MQTSKVLLLDDHRLLVQAVGGLLSQFCDLDRLDLCGSVAEALERITTDPPDLLILDLHLPSERWQDAADALSRHNPSAQLIILSATAADFVLPERPFPKVLAVIDKKHACDDLLALVAQWQHQRQGCRCDAMAMQQLIEELSPREKRVFVALGKGLLNKEIAAALGLTVATVDTYRKAISTKLGLSGPELVRAAVLHHCLPPV